MHPAFETWLADVDANPARANVETEKGRPADKVCTIEEWSLLGIRHEGLVKRAETAKQEGSEEWLALHTSFRKEADDLAESSKRWLTRLS